MKLYIKTEIVEAELYTIRTRTGYQEGYWVEEYYGGRFVPKNEFEKNHRPVDGMTFGQALEAMKLGKKVRRKEWEGWMFIVLINKDFYKKLEDAPHHEVTYCPLCEGDFMHDDWQIVDYWQIVD